MKDKDVRKINAVEPNKEKKKKRKISFRAKILLYTLISALVAVLFVIALTLIVGEAGSLINDNKDEVYIIHNDIKDADTVSQATKPYIRDGKFVLDYDKLFFERVDGIKTIRYKSVIMLLFQVISFVVVFLATFFKLSEPYVLATSKIDKGITSYIEGDFSEAIVVKGNDELSSIADNINLLAERFQKIREDEHNTELAKNELITSIAHDLRTPITSIIGYLDLINSGNIDEQTRDKYINIAYDKSKRLEKLIEDLFTYTKFSLGQYTLNYTELDLVKLIEQLVDEFYPQINAQELKLSLVSKESQIMIEADGELLARLFANLISNSLKYGKDGKVLRIVVERSEGYGVVKVTNFGQLIPSEDLDNIFKRFYRLENSRSRQTGGSGLGLSIVKQIVEIHKGDISVTSDVSGTTFKVRLPINISHNTVEE